MGESDTATAVELAPHTRDIPHDAPVEDTKTAAAAPLRATPFWGILVIGALAAALSSNGTGRMLFSGDELATISAANRPLGELWTMLGNVDIHQGLYYTLMHGWLEFFAPNEFTTRLPSALAVGIAAVGLVILGNLISTPKVAVTAGVVFAILPRVTLAGSDTRVAALTMLLGVWLTVYCVLAARRGKPWWWIVYAIFVVVAILTNLYLVLLLPAHALAVKSLATKPAALRYWAAAAVTASVAMIPFVVLAASKFSAGWIPRLSGETVKQVLVNQYFGTDFGEYFSRSLLASIGAGVILVAGVVVAVRSGRARSGASVAIVLTWIAVPTVALLAVSIFRPAYLPRYMAFTAPAFALLLAMCITTIGRSWPRIIAIVVVFAIAIAPVYLAQRDMAMIRNEQEYGPIAKVLDESAVPGDCLLIEDPNAKRWPPVWSLVAVRPTVYEKLRMPNKGWALPPCSGHGICG